MHQTELFCMVTNWPSDTVQLISLIVTLRAETCNLAAVRNSEKVALNCIAVENTYQWLSANKRQPWYVVNGVSYLNMDRPLLMMAV